MSLYLALSVSVFIYTYLSISIYLYLYIYLYLSLSIIHLYLSIYTLWGSLWLYTTLLQARAGLVAGLLRDSEVAVFCVHFMPVLRQRISTELRTILSRQSAPV